MFGGFLEHQLRGILGPRLRRLLPFVRRLRAQFLHNRGALQAGRATHNGDEHRVSDYWGKQFEAMRTDNSYWLNNKLVEESTYRLMTDTPNHWLGWLLNFPPYAFIRNFIRKKVKDAQFIGSLKYAFGLFLVPVYYVVILVLCLVITGSLPATLIAALILPVSGIIAADSLRP